MVGVMQKRLSFTRPSARQRIRISSRSRTCNLESATMSDLSWKENLLETPLLVLGHNSLNIHFWTMTIWHFWTASRSLTQKSKKIGKNQNRLYRLFWGRRCWLAVALSFLFFYTAVPFWKKNFFYRVNFGTFWRSGKKCTFGWWKFKKLWKFSVEFGGIWGKFGGGKQF